MFINKRLFLHSSLRVPANKAPVIQTSPSLIRHMGTWVNHPQVFKGFYQEATLTIFAHISLTKANYIAIPNRKMDEQSNPILCPDGRTVR